MQTLVTIQISRINQIFVHTESSVSSRPSLKRLSQLRFLSNYLCPSHLLFTLFLMTTTFLAPPSLAQPSSLLGPSCNGDRSRVFPIEKLSQEGTPWCWAITSAIVMMHHDKDLSPCQLVSKELQDSTGEQVDCCNAEGNEYDKCLIQAPISKVLTDNNFGFKYEKILDPKTDLSYTSISEQLCKNGPFISTVTAPRIRHAVVVYGYAIDDDEDDPAKQLQVFVHDSQEEWPPSVNYEYFLEAGTLDHKAKHVSFCHPKTDTSSATDTRCPSD